VSATDRDRTAALARVADRVATLRAVLDEYAPAIEKRETSRLSAWPQRKRSGEKVSSYHGRATTTVVVRDLDMVGEVMLRVADLDQSMVDGPWWSVRPASPAFKDVRRAAIDEAIARGREYAEALNARIVGLVELTDVGMIAPHAVALGHFRSREGASYAGQPELDLDPQRQQITAQIEARFTISFPGALADPED
jgi:uncharacterized protein YggE